MCLDLRKLVEHGLRQFALFEIEKAIVSQKESASILVAGLLGFEGFEGFELLKPTDERLTWLVITRWKDEESFQAWVNSPAFGHGHQGAGAPHSQHGGPVSVSSELWSYEVSTGSPGGGS